MGYNVLVESGAGNLSNFQDDKYVTAGAKISTSAAEVFKSDLILKIRPPGENKALGKHESSAMKKDATVISMVHPAQNSELVEKMKKSNVTSFAMD